MLAGCWSSFSLTLTASVLELALEVFSPTTCSLESRNTLAIGAYFPQEDNVSVAVFPASGGMGWGGVGWSTN